MFVQGINSNGTLPATNGTITLERRSIWDSIKNAASSAANAVKQAAGDVSNTVNKAIGGKTFFQKVLMVGLLTRFDRHGTNVQR